MYVTIPVIIIPARKIIDLNFTEFLKCIRSFFIELIILIHPFFGFFVFYINIIFYSIYILGYIFDFILIYFISLVFFLFFSHFLFLLRECWSLGSPFILFPLLRSMTTATLYLFYNFF